MATIPKPRTAPVRNTVLAARIQQTGLSYAKIAAKINAVAAENGYFTRYNRGSISNWLTGRTPLPEVIPVIVEAVSQLLGTPHLRPCDLGWGSGDTTELASPWAGDPVTWLDHLGRCDMTDLDRRAVLGVGLFSVGVAAVPPLPRARSNTSASTLVRAGMSDVARIREMTETFSGMDDRFGGGHARGALAAYLSGHVVPLLHGAAGPSRPTLMSAGGELAYLAGFMAADAGFAGLAQRYYVQAARLASEAPNRELHATVLRAMALQAVELGHPRSGRDLADAAARSLRPRGPTRLRAWVTAMQAEAAAAAGEARTARELLRTAERDLEHADSPQASSWTGGFSRPALNHQTGTSLVSLGELVAAEEHLAASVAARGAAECRSRALIGARLAVVQAKRGREAAAAQTVAWITKDLRAVESARVTQELRALRTSWRQACRDPCIEKSDRTVADILGRKSAGAT